MANIPGFVGNRCIFVYIMESMLLLEGNDDDNNYNNNSNDMLSIIYTKIQRFPTNPGILAT